MRPGSKMLLFGSLLVAVVGLTVLFASGLLRFGTGALPTYVLYVLSGLLASVLCFGLLRSSGRFDGQKSGARLELGGAVIALVLVAGGGGAYERWFRTPEHFTFRIRVLSSATRQPQQVTGTVDVLVGNNRWSAHLSNESNAQFEMIPTAMSGRTAAVSVVAPPFEAKADSTVVITMDASGELLVAKNDELEKRYAGMVRGRESGQPLQGVRLLLVGAGCPTDTDGAGHFEFRCGKAARLERARVLIKLPARSDFCSEAAHLQDPPLLSDIVVDSDCRTNSNPANPGPTPTPIKPHSDAGAHRSYEDVTECVYRRCRPYPLPLPRRRCVIEVGPNGMVRIDPDWPDSDACEPRAVECVRACVRDMHVDLRETTRFAFPFWGRPSLP